jgi:phage terminase large subunit-like protein
MQRMPVATDDETDFASTSPVPVQTDPATDYARAVVAGEIVAGRLVRLACQRHLQDLAEGPARGLRWDPSAAGRVFQFAKYLKLPDGSAPFVLHPAQKFILGCLFGWKGPDGHRRFRNAYCEMGKGNGKSPLAALIGLYGLVADGEAAPEIYAAATTREQAKIMFTDARNMARASPILNRKLTIHEHNIANLSNVGFFRTVSSEGRGLDGKRPHIGLIDEIHEHPTAVVCDKLRAGLKGRQDGLIFEITNSGHDRHSVCWDHHEYSRKILEGALEDDAWFAYVCGLDPCEAHLAQGQVQPVAGCEDCDDWRDESVWLKANPLLDVSITRKYLREQVHEAKGRPSKAGIVQRLNFCIWTETQSIWIPSDLWARGNKSVTLDECVESGWSCFAGFDLANRFDLTAAVLLFRSPATTAQPSVYKLIPYFWIPEAIASKKERIDKVPYKLWRDRGLVRFTKGDVTDYNEIERFFRDEIAMKIPIVGVGYDPYQATQLASNLGAFGLKLHEFTQNARNFHEPVETFEKLLAEGNIHHGGHPALTWNASNVEIKLDLENRKRPVKPDQYSPKKIDGIVAALIALGVSFLYPEGTSEDDGSPMGWV